MELRHLRYFLAVADELNFRRASERLHISHPALSKQIRDLEEEIGVTLLERSTARVLLTPAGKQFQKDAADILKRVDQMINRIGNFSTDSDQLVIGWPGPFGEYLLPPILNAFRKSHPKISIRTFSRYPNEQLQALQEGKLDIGFVPNREIRSKTGLNQKLLIKSKLGVILGKDHPLCRYKTLKCDQLRGETFLYLGPKRGSIHLADIRKMLPKAMFRLSQFQNAEGMDSLIPFIISGHGISILPREFASMRRGQVRFRKLTDIENQKDFDLWAVWRKQSPSVLLTDFLSLLTHEQRD